MAENKNIENEFDITEGESLFITLTDEETGEEFDFEVIGECERDGQRYFAMIPVNDPDASDDVCEYVILKLSKDGDEEILVSVDDDDELDDVADYFDDLFSQEIDYDN